MKYRIALAGIALTTICACGGDSTSDEISTEVDTTAVITSPTEQDGLDGISQCLDTFPTGDGWGWNGTESCQITGDSEPPVAPELGTESTLVLGDINGNGITDTFEVSTLYSNDINQNLIADVFDVVFTRGTDSNGNDIDDLFEPEISKYADENSDLVSDLPFDQLILNRDTAPVPIFISSDGADTENSFDLFASATGNDGSYPAITEQTCDGSHAGFGTHVLEQYNAELNQSVFEFVLHKEDSDCATGWTDRQRLYTTAGRFTSPNSYATQNQWLTISFDFFVPEDFSPTKEWTTFLQFHPLGARESVSMFSLQQLSIRRNDDFKWFETYYIGDYANGDEFEGEFLEFSTLAGKWINVFARTNHSKNGSFEMVIRDKFTDRVLWSVTHWQKLMYRQGTELGAYNFGIYRGLSDQNNLADVHVLMNNMCIIKNATACPR